MNEKIADGEKTVFLITEDQKRRKVEKLIEKAENGQYKINKSKKQKWKG